MTDPGSDESPQLADASLAPGAGPSPEAGTSPQPTPSPESGISPEPDASDRLAIPVPRRPTTFSLEGRRAPGLYLAGWVGMVLGIVLIIVEGAARASGLGGLILTAVAAILTGLGLIAAGGAQAIERQSRPELAYRGPAPVLVFAASVPLVVLVEIPAILAGVSLSSPTGTLISVLITDGSWVFLVGLIVVGTASLGWSEIAPGILGVRRSQIARDVFFGAIAAIPVTVATIILLAVLVPLLGSQPASSITTPRDATSLAIDLLAAAVIAPIGEEIFYRGFTTTAWARAAGPTAAIIRGALFFSLVHIVAASGSTFADALLTATASFAARVPVALALGWVFLRRASLPASIGLHASYNAILILLSFAASGVVR